MLFGAAAAFHEVHLDRSRVIGYTLAVMGYGLLAQTSISSFSSRYRCRTAARLRICHHGRMEAVADATAAHQNCPWTGTLRIPDQWGEMRCKADDERKDWSLDLM